MEIKKIEAVILTDNNNQPIKLLDIKSFKDSKTYLEFKESCVKNQEEHERQLREKELRIEMLEQRLYKIETELAYNRGEISEKEYNEICLGIK